MQKYEKNGNVPHFCSTFFVLHRKNHYLCPVFHLMRSSLTQNRMNQEPNKPDSSLSLEEATRQWWLQQFGTPLPEEVKTWMRNMVRRELQKARIAEHHLDDSALQKVREGRRLCQTKFDNVEESIARIRQQQERIRKFVAINTEFDKQRQHLYEVNKRQASLLNEQQQLERFETFEAINGIFQRIRTLDKSIEDARMRLGELGIKADGARRSCDEAEKQLVVEQGKVQEAVENMVSAAQTMTEGQRLQTNIDNGIAQKNAYEEMFKRLETKLDILRKQYQEVVAGAEQEQGYITDLKLKRQALEAHRAMIERGYAVQIELEEFAKVQLLRDQLSAQLATAIRQQNERNEQLGKLFNESQDIDANVKALQEEANGHRSSIAGQESYTLQRRALELRSRKQMLETGSSLWKNIAKGYDLIEHKEQLMTQLRLRAEHLNRSVDDLENEIRQLGQQLEQKTYHWTLSKSQNVIELRGDLQEGEPCTVCGATHHPWQSDTINEQNALISSLKADCENFEAELRIKRRQLDEWKTELTAIQGKLEVENENLLTLIERQRQDTDEWQIFSQLDRSFAECSPSTNREARTAMIRQLIEKTTVDAEQAEKELNAFTFHLDAISRIGTKVQAKQQQAADLAIRLNEVNTACQVMAGQVERLNQRMGAVTQDYSQRYEILGRDITIPEWFKEWKSAPEGLRMHIQDMMDQWKAINESLIAHEKKAAVFSIQQELLRQSIERTILESTKVETRINQAKEQISKAEDALGKLLPTSDGQTVFKETRGRLARQQEQAERTEESFQNQLKTRLFLEAQINNLNDTTRRTEEWLATERRELDIWMRQYNADNPPVQFAELQRVLADGKDWTAIRKEVRAVIMEQAITQARVDHLRAQIIALQAEGLRSVVGEGEVEQATLQHQKDELEHQRRNILQQMAHFDEQLRAHEQTGSLITAEEVNKS